MKFNTIFDIGQTAYYIADNRIQSYEVAKIKIETVPKRNEISIVYVNDGQNISRPERELFKSPAELADKLIESVR